MRLEDLVRLVLDSEPSDWNVMTCWGSGSAPSYRDRFDVWKSGSGQQGRWGLEVESHGMAACFKSDVSITMAWGMTSNEDFQEEWANSFPDPHASSSWVDLFYNGGLVFRELYVTVDGGRVHLPLPRDEGGRLLVPSGYANLCRLLGRLETGGGGGRFDFDNALTRAGFNLTSEPWPFQ